MTEKKMTSAESRQQELGNFPYIDHDWSESKFEKHQRPFIPKEEAHDYYQKNGHELLKRDELQEMYRFNVERLTYLKPGTPEERKEYTNMVTLSKPSSDVICLRRNPKTGNPEMCLMIQPRTPYNAVVNGETYARFFMEHVGGLLEKGETFEEAALRETEEEIGWKIKTMIPLIAPAICKHVSYATETTKMFLAVVDEEVGQNLDENEDIKTKWYPIDTVEEELEAYLDGKKETFFGFDAPEMTILGFTRFFARWHRKFDLLEVKETLGGVEALESYI